MGEFYSDSLEEGIRLLYFQTDESRYPEGVRLIQRAAKDGEGDAYYFLARCYAWGDGKVPEDMEKARELSQDGIAKGSDLCVLGAKRFDGLTGEAAMGPGSALKDAFHGVQKQAEEGNPMAQYAVALFYYWGDISLFQKPATQEEYEENERENALESLKWYRQAALKGCIPAFRNHYACLANGTNGAPHDPAAAMNFVEEVKDHVEIPLSFYVEFAAQYRELDQKEKALWWLEAGADRGDPDSLNSLGIEYLNGGLVQENDATAARLFRQAADRGDKFGMYNLGRCLHNGWGVEQDDGAAFQCFYEAALGGIAGAQWFLAVCYYNGFGTKINYEECFSWSAKAVDGGSQNAATLLGKCYLYGHGAPQDTDKARHYLAPMADKGDPEALYLLGEMYDKALGVRENINSAVFYYKKAARKGSAEAKALLPHFKKSLLGGRWKRCKTDKKGE